MYVVFLDNQPDCYVLSYDEAQAIKQELEESTGSRVDIGEW